MAAAANDKGGVIVGEKYVLACSTVPEISGTEVKFSIKSGSVTQLRDWPLHAVECQTITPTQSRLQWGVNTFGPRLDSYKALRLGDERYNFEIGMRSTNAGGRLRAVEEQRVGVAPLTLAGQYQLSYWNDHAFPFWPTGALIEAEKGVQRLTNGAYTPAKATDQGDTAGFRFSLLAGNQGFPLKKGWQFQSLNISLRLATGIPDLSSTVTRPDGKFYSRVEFDGIDHGDIDVNATLTKSDQQRLTVGIFVNAAEIRQATQGKLVHQTLGIPELPYKGQKEAMIYLKLEGW